MGRMKCALELAVFKSLLPLMPQSHLLQLGVRHLANEHNGKNLPGADFYKKNSLYFLEKHL